MELQDKTTMELEDLPPKIDETPIETSSISKKSELSQTEKRIITNQPPSLSKKSIWKNLVIISLCLTGVMTSYDMVRYVESSLNSKNGLGAASLSCIYAMNIVCGLFFPTFFIQRYGCKRTFTVAVFCAFVYYALHFYPTYYTLLPGGLFMGFALGLARSTANTLVTDLAAIYSKLTTNTTEQTINLFFGFLILTSFSARIWGNLASSLILTSDNSNYVNTNQSICGSNYCSQNLKPTNALVAQTSDDFKFGNNDPNSPVSQQAYTLYGIALAAGVVTLLLLVIFLDDRKEGVSGGGLNTILRQASAAAVLVKEPQMILMIPITFTLGLVESYMSSDFTQAFVTCSIGIHHVGFVIICYGCTATLSSYFWGWLANKLTRVFVVLLGTCINIAAIFVMLYWKPDPSFSVVYYLLSGTWGLADAVWRSQLFAMYGYVFYARKEAGFSNFEVWESIGLVVGYAYHGSLCIAVKLYIIFGMLLFGVTCYLIVEFMVWKAKRKGESLSTAFQS